MAEPKTTKTAASVNDFLQDVEPAGRRADAIALCQLMTKATGAQPAMWGSSIVGYGSYHYGYASGRTGDWPAVGFSPRKANLTVYLSTGFDDYKALLADLGPYTTGKACLYIKRLEDVDAKALAKLVKAAFKALDGKILTT